MSIHAQIKWTDGMQFIARARKGPVVVIDSRDGGTGTSPMEMVLMGVGGCTAMDVISIMRKKRVQIDDFHVNITGEYAEKHPKRYTDIRIEYVFRGKDIKPKAVEHAIKLSETKYCSAMASLNANFAHSYRILGADE